MIIIQYISQISFIEKEYIYIKIELVIQVWYFISNNNELCNSSRVSFIIKALKPNLWTDPKVFIRQYQFIYNELQILSFYITDIPIIYLLETFYRTLNYLLKVFW